VKEQTRPFAEWFSASMQARGVSQAEVARNLGVADAQVSRWRRGHVVPSRRHVHQIAAAFRVPCETIEHLVGHVEPVAEMSVAPDIDSVRQAEEQAILQALANILEQRVPRSLWGAYARGCEVLAEEMTLAFEHAVEASQAESSRRIGFHVGASDNESGSSPTG